jgi:hypothetical protein
MEHKIGGLWFVETVERMMSLNGCSSIRARYQKDTVVLGKTRGLFEEKNRTFLERSAVLLRKGVAHS